MMFKQTFNIKVFFSVLLFLIIILASIFYIQYRNKQNYLVDSLKRVLDNDGIISYYRDGDIEKPIIESILSRDLERYNIITHLRVKYINCICVKNQLPIQDIALFGKLEFLDKLCFVDVNLSESHLKLIVKNIPHLKTLFIERGAFPKNGMKYLGELKEIDSLFLFNLPINDENISEMRGTPLREIIFIDIPVTDIGLDTMLPLEKLEDISFQYLPITDGITVFFDGCPHLKRIYISNSKDNNTIIPNELKCSFLRDMIHTSSIEEIKLHGVMIDDKILSSIDRFKNLKYLSVRTYCATEASKMLLEKFSQRMYVGMTILGQNGEILFEYSGGEKFLPD